MFERCPKASGELAMGHQDHSDHQISISRPARASDAINPSANSQAAYFCALRRIVQAKFRDVRLYRRQRSNRSTTEIALSTDAGGGIQANPGHVDPFDGRNVRIGGPTGPSAVRAAQFDKKPDHGGEFARRRLHPCRAPLDEPGHMRRAGRDESAVRSARTQTRSSPIKAPNRPLILARANSARASALFPDPDAPRIITPLSP